MKEDYEYARTIEHAIPYNEDKLTTTETQTEFWYGYRQAIGELMYIIIIYRLDKSFSLIKFSQYSANPIREHFLILRGIHTYIRYTTSEGTYWWRS